MHKAISGVITIAAPRPPLIQAKQMNLYQVAKTAPLLPAEPLPRPIRSFLQKILPNTQNRQKWETGAKTRIGKRAVLWYDILS